LAWTAEFDPRALKELEKLDKSVQKRVVEFIQQRILGTPGPRELGKALQGGKVKLWRYRVGDYRLICRIHDEASRVRVLRVAHRREVYR